MLTLGSSIPITLTLALALSAVAVAPAWGGAVPAHLHRTNQLIVPIGGSIGYARRGMLTLVSSKDDECNQPKTAEAWHRCLLAPKFDPTSHRKGVDFDDVRATPESSSAREPVPENRGAQIALNFPSGSADLPSEVGSILNDIAGKALSREANSGHRIRIEGHTDTVGSAAFNMALSKARANAVAAYLSETYHIDPAALDVAGVGKTKQIVPTPDQTPDQSNRVVLFYAE